MNLKILLPFRVFADLKNVKRIVMETSEGSYGLLPQRLDCVAALVPGIFTYETDRVYDLAVDEGVMIKAGQEVLVSVWNAIEGADLGKLRETVETAFQLLDEEEKHARSVMDKMENGLVVRLEKIRDK